MPEIDEDLFRMLALAGLALIVVLLSIALAMLKRLAPRTGGSEPGHVDPLEHGGSIAVRAMSEPANEQPFEKGGHWYYRRGGELLVYEETTGEWVSAETEPESELQRPAMSPDPNPRAEAFGELEKLSRTEAPIAVEDEPEATDAGGFWKCPTCAAVNTSSSATCRMCFSAKP